MKQIRCTITEKRPKAYRIAVKSTLGNIIEVWVPISQIIASEIIPTMANRVHHRDEEKNFRTILTLPDWIIEEKEIAEIQSK